MSDKTNTLHLSNPRLLNSPEIDTPIVATNGDHFLIRRNRDIINSISTIECGKFAMLGQVKNSEQVRVTSSSTNAPVLEQDAALKTCVSLGLTHCLSRRAVER